MLLTVHIAAGGLAIVLGAIALIVKKGGTIHRRSGMLFVYAMLTMGLSASILGSLKDPPENERAGFLIAYFVVTALTTVRPSTRWTRVINVVALLIAATLATFAIVGSVKIFNLPGRTYNGVPFFAPLIIATVLIMAAIGDVRVLRSGMPQGGRRLARHLWRMCFALFIAAGSFFSIRSRVAKVLPEPFTTGPMRALPIVLLFGLASMKSLKHFDREFALTNRLRTEGTRYLLDAAKAVGARKFVARVTPAGRIGVKAIASRAKTIRSIRTRRHR